MKITFITCWCYLRIYAVQSRHLKENLESITDNKIKLVTSNCSCYNSGILSTATAPFSYRYLLSGEVDKFIRLPHIRNRDGTSITHRLARFYRSLSEPMRGNQYIKSLSDCDIAHFHQASDAFGYSAVAYFLNHVHDKKKVVTIHNLSPQQWQNPSLNQIYNHADALIVHNHYFKNVITESGVEANKIHVIPYGAVLKPLKEYKRQGIIMFAGSPLIDVKGFEYIASALHKLREENIVIPLKLHGFHMRGHQEWANDIIRKENIEDQSEWLKIRNEDELIDAYQNSMMCVVPYTGYPGSFPISMALSNALPVIVGDTLGMPEYVDGAGIVFKSKSVNEIASALKKIYGDEVLRNKMGNQGRLTAEKLFSWPTVAEQTLAVYKRFYINNSLH